MNSAHSFTEGMDVPKDTASKTFLNMCKMRKSSQDAPSKKTRRLIMFVIFAAHIGMKRASLMKIKL